jgi:acetyl esterase/lipase
LMNPKQYALVDLDTGRIDPIDAPVGLALLYAGPEKAIWSRSGQSFLLVNTYMPLANTEGSERQKRLQKPCIALFDKTLKRATCIATVKQQNSREEVSKTEFGYFLRDVLWDEAANYLVLSYETFGNENDPTHHERAPEVYQQESGHWVMENTLAQRTPDSLRVELRQDLNDPPALFVSRSGGDHALKLWDPNPQLKGIDLGEVSVLHWKDKAGNEWTGGLVKPPDYIPGHKYPLVIQTHGFNRHQFMTVGAFTTAFAARPLAATGMVVLQVDERFDLQGTPEEAPLHVEAYLSAIDRLANDGLVDSERVGLIGFSRTGYYTLQALTKAPRRFQAATIADSDFLGYMQRLISVDDSASDSRKQEGIRIYGSQPFGGGLKTWIERAPAFNLDKVLAPLRIEVHDLNSLVGDWEVYAGLRLQGKPVDMIQLPDAVHVVVKPLERLASEQGDVDWFDFWLTGREDPDPAKANQYARWRLLRERREENLRSSQ